MKYLEKHKIPDFTIIPKRMAVVMRWNNIGCKALQRELDYGNWYFDRMMSGIEPPDSNDLRRLTNMFGGVEMQWVLGQRELMPFWLRENA